MVMDPEQPDQEKELEQFYLNFAQPNNLTVKQCLIVALQVVKEGSYGLAGWQGESLRSCSSCGWMVILSVEVGVTEGLLMVGQAGGYAEGLVETADFAVQCSAVCELECQVRTSQGMCCSKSPAQVQLECLQHVA